MGTKIFVSHIDDESDLALILKSHLSKDFLGLAEIFVSSDVESISAGENWLQGLEKALRDSSILLALCSHGSLNRPWVNFEVGAAWMQSIPIVPICHSGLRPSDLTMPFSVLHAVQANSAADLERIHSLVANKLGCKPPVKDFAGLINEVIAFEKEYQPKLQATHKDEIQRRSASLKRLYDALRDPRYNSRYVDRLAVIAAITEDEVLDLLAPDPNVAFNRGDRTGRRTARLKTR